MNILHPDRIDRPNVFRRQQAAIQPLIEIYERAAVRKLPQQVQVFLAGQQVRVQQLNMFLSPPPLVTMAL